MKIFIIALVFIAATIFPILFFPLLALTLIILLIVAPHVLKNGLGMWSDEEHIMESHKH
jgi:hypothetical protein